MSPLLQHDNVDASIPLSLALGVVLHVVDGVSAAHALLAFPVLALCAQELLSECRVVGGGGGLLDDNLLPVIGDLVDDPLGRLSELKVVEGRNALGGDGDTAMGVSPCATSGAPNKCRLGTPRQAVAHFRRAIATTTRGKERTYPD